MRRATRAGDGAVTSVQIDEPALDTDREREFYVTDWIGDRAADFITERAGGEAPFFLFVSFTAPHTPMEARGADLDAVAGIEPERRRVYAAMMRSLDRAVGTITEAIDEAGVARRHRRHVLQRQRGRDQQRVRQRTLPGHEGQQVGGGRPRPRRDPLAGQDRARHPLHPDRLVDGPDGDRRRPRGRAHRGGRAARRVRALPRPRRRGGRGPAGQRDPPGLFWQRGPVSAVRAGPWKLIVTPEGTPLLYHIPADPSETTDLAGERPRWSRCSWACSSPGGTRWSTPSGPRASGGRRNQLRKHRPEVIGRDAERRFP
jgi:hypothetical protein